MGLYGNEMCIFNENHPNPFYLANCNNPEVLKDTVESTFCNNCEKAVVPDFSDGDGLEELIEKLEGKKKEMVREYTLKVLKGYKQPWEE